MTTFRDGDSVMVSPDSSRGKDQEGVCVGDSRDGFTRVRIVKGLGTTDFLLRNERLRKI